uniref:Uncharacterized protein n=1 Tax=Picea glauca TaxID=3330 RepID=A0A117NJ61_PICGL|nr:hypothetical protein ABT39_MTgene867 [Picea glauca]
MQCNPEAMYVRRLLSIPGIYAHPMLPTNKHNHMYGMPRMDYYAEISDGKYIYSEAGSGNASV